MPIFTSSAFSIYFSSTVSASTHSKNGTPIVGNWDSSDVELDDDYSEDHSCPTKLEYDFYEKFFASLKRFISPVLGILLWYD